MAYTGVDYNAVTLVLILRWS